MSDISEIWLVASLNSGLCQGTLLPPTSEKGWGVVPCAPPSRTCTSLFCLCHGWSSEEDADTPVADCGGLNEFPKHTGYRGLTMSWHSVNQLIITIKDAVMITGRGGGVMFCDELSWACLLNFHNSSISSAVLQMRKWGSGIID